MQRFFTIILFQIIFSLVSQANKTAGLPEFSKAGFYKVENSGREVFNFNIGWRFLKGDIASAETTGFDDSDWDVVNCPHGLELISSEASGSNNYQGVAWYRKHFTIADSVISKRLTIDFEGVMGKCKVWLNGELVAEHFGGYLPFSADLTGKILQGKKNVIAVWVDNSDDPDYPPGKPQANLDFCYFGGIYRDVWLTATNKIYVTNPNEVDKVAGGGIFTYIDELSEKQSLIGIDVDIQNDKERKETVNALLRLINPEGELAAEQKVTFEIGAKSSYQIHNKISVENPQLWTPWSPNLYRLEVLLTGRNGKTFEGVATRIGIRKIEMRGKDGFYLNNKPYPGKLIGANRHQDYGYVGNAVSNNAQWRDAKLLKDAGCDIVRAAHYPVDPAFMDACDELGLFYIVATPGWQFWNKKPVFEQRVFSDIKNMVRRDRNHPAVLMWEPILNETWYPDYFAKKVHGIVHDEFPFQGAFTVCDAQARGQENFDVIYSHPFKSEFYQKDIENTEQNKKAVQIDYASETRCIFTREWGDCVDNWNSHNSPSRVARNWGEHAQLVQVKHYANPDYVYTCWETLYETPAQHIGGALWHSFDYQRGYHPDTFYGGITDVFRQPKYSYYLFASQRDIANGNKPMVFIANEMTPFSESDVTVFSNCDEVRLIVFEKDTLVQKASDYNLQMPHPVFTFKNVFNFMKVKTLHRANKRAQASLIAEGLVDGKVVARFKRMAAERPTQIVLTVENNGAPFLANGTDFVRIIASVTDRNGNVKRLNNSDIRFEIEGEGTIIGDDKIFANPKKVEWGTAPVFVRSSLKAGKIKVKASVADEGIHTPVSAEIIFESVPCNENFIYSETGNDFLKGNFKTETYSTEELRNEIKKLNKEINDLKLKEVERQQKEFEGK